MKNNDYDFIKNKFDEAALDVPDSLSAESIEEKILSNQPNNRTKLKKKRMNFKPIVIVAACFILIISALFVINRLKPSLLSFESYNELNEKINSLEYLPIDSEMGCGEFCVSSYNAEAGVVMPNTITAANGYIYYAYYNHYYSENRNKVFVFKAENGEATLVSIIDGFDLDDTQIEAVFARDNRLTVIFSKSSSNETLAKIYDVTDNEKPVLVSELLQSGGYGSSRLVDGNLYIITNRRAIKGGGRDDIPYIKLGKNKLPAEPKNIFCLENAKYAQYAVISAFDLQTGNQAMDLEAVLGADGNIYCTSEYMYFSNGDEPAANAVKLSLKNKKMNIVSEDDEYYERVTPVNDDDWIDGVSYLFESGRLEITANMNTGVQAVALYDESGGLLDGIKVEDAVIYTNAYFLAVNDDETAFAVPVYTWDEARRYYGVLAFKIKDNKIVEERFTNDNVYQMYQGKCIFVGDYLFSFDENDSLSDEKKLTPFSYKY